jgi:hypothetical protein
VVENILAQSGNLLHTTLVVMPNTRGVAYMRKAFQKQNHNQTLILPTLSGMDELIKNLNSDTLLSVAEANLLLFKSFRKIKNNREILSQFLPLGQVLLSDFEEIVRGEKLPHQVFGELKRWFGTGESFADYLEEDQKEVLRRFSSHFSGDSSEGRKYFVEISEQIPALYAEFEEEMRESSEQRLLKG